METDAPRRVGRDRRPATDERARAATAPARLTRRELLLATAGAAGAALAGCATSSARAPAATATHPPFTLKRPATLYADGVLPRATVSAMAQHIAGQGGVPSVTLVPARGPSTDLVLTLGPPLAGYVGTPVGTSALAAITHLRVPIDGVTPDQAHDLFSGRVTDWHAVGSPYSLPVRLYTLAGLPALPGLTIAAGAQSVATPEALVEQVRGQPGSLALVPMEVVDWTVRNLGIGDAYPAQGRGEPTGPFAPLVVWLGVAKALAARGLDARALALRMAPALASATATFDMVVSGDIILGRGVNAKMVAYNDFLYPYRKVRDEFMSADWRVANLECTISDLAGQPADPATFTFVTARRAVDGLAYAGIQTVTLANNHADNAGIPPFTDMLQTLRDNKIAYCGGGASLAEARQPTVHTVKGVRVALLGYDDIPPGGPYAGDASAGIAPIDLATLPQDLTAARAQADLVIPYFHWGIEYTKVATRYQQQVAHTAIDAGADMVLGSHPHWAQSIETYKGRLIVYSLANFIFDQDWSRETLEGFMIHLYWRGTTLAGIRFVPTLIEDRCQPRIMSPAEAVGVFDRMWSGTDLLASGQYTPGPY